MIDVTVSLQTKLEKSPFYYAVLHWIDPIKKDQYKWKSTKIRYIEETKKRLHNQAEQEANKKAEEFRKAFEEELNTKVISRKSLIDEIAKQTFSDYLINWAKGTEGKKEEGTSSQYETNINGIIAPYFKKTGILLEELQPIHLQNFYDTQYKRILTKGKNKGKPVSKNTVWHYHTTIHKALNDAVRLNLIPFNPDDRTDVARPDKYIASYYNEDEANELLEKAINNSLELIINLATCYGLRRSEILGLKWSAINFDGNTITINHKVTQATVDKKRVLVQKDKLKNKSSYRTFPLIPQVKDLLLKEIEKQSKNKKIYGNTYKNKDNYICVKDDGEIMKPDTITRNFPKFLKQKGLKKIRLHDLRHSCASILLANGVPMKEIQEYLGHSSYNTTANIYAHVDSNSKENSANTMSNILSKQKSA